MKYTIYKIINKINNKIYIGKHQTNDLDDGYMGSGKMLRRAQKKYGIDNFSKIVLHVFDNEQEMNAKETELVTQEFCLREDTYNICVGGQGGFSYINNNPDKFLTEKRLKALWSNKQRTERRKELYSSNPVLRERQSDIARAAGKKSRENNPLGTFYGKSHSDEAKKIIGEKNSIAMKGEGNSQYGSMWITNGSQSQKIKTVGVIPEGWYRGRVITNRNVGEALK